MKLVVAIVQPQQLPAIKHALFGAQIRHLTVTNVLGTAAEGVHMQFRGVSHEVTLFQKVRIELAVNDAMVEVAMDAIARGCRDSGGFGFVFVTPLYDAMNVRSGDRGERAV